VIAVLQADNLKSAVLETVFVPPFTMLNFRHGLEAGEAVNSIMDAVHRWNRVLHLQTNGH
jgi:hypothetical protein